jgi:hypothetical protein
MNRRSGMALLVVMVLTMLLALGAYQFSFQMESQYRQTRIFEEQAQARLAAFSGLEIAAAILEQPPVVRRQLGDLRNAPLLFQHQPVSTASPEATSPASSARLTSDWRFSIVAPGAISGQSGSDQVLLRFGLQNEHAKLHIPTLLQWERLKPGQAREALLRLPHATAETVDAVLRKWGFSGPASSPGNMPSIEERIATQSGGGQPMEQARLRNAVASLWDGGDLNQNYRLDPVEIRIQSILDTTGSSTPGTSLPSGNATSDNVLPAPAGWQRFLTWHHGERNESSKGEPRIYLNESNLQNLHQSLLAIWPAEWANFVIAVRQYGPVERLSVGSSQTSSNGSQWTPDFSVPARYQIPSLLSLVNCRLSISQTSSGRQSDGTETVSMISPFMLAPAGGTDYVSRLLDEATTMMEKTIVGRIDLEEASAEVLAAIPGWNPSLLETINASRVEDPIGETYEHPLARLGNSGRFPLEQLIALEPYIAARSDTYSVQVIGYRDAQTPMVRCTAVLDATGERATQVELRTWQAWESGFTIEQLSTSDQAATEAPRQLRTSSE